MNITSIRFNSKKPTEKQLKQLCSLIESRMKTIGFEVGAWKITSSAVKVSAHRQSFTVNPLIRGHNLRHNPMYPKPRLTRTPTWNQRVEFNVVLNGILDSLAITANIKSGEYTIRKGFTVYTESDWDTQQPSWERENIDKGHYISSKE